MGTGAQLAPAAAPSRKTERVLKVQPIAIGTAVADSLLQLLHGIAAERVTQEMSNRLRSAFQGDPAFVANVDPSATSEVEFVERNVNNPSLLAMAQIPSYERYTFLAPGSNVQFDSTQFDLRDIPKDLDLFLAHADGINGRFVDVRLQTKFKDFNEVRNWQLNQIVVQGEDHNWVHAIHETLRSSIEPEYFSVRRFIYKNCLTLFWASFVLLLFAEYRATKWLNPDFSLKAPLSGTGAILMFGILTASMLIFSNAIIPLFTYWFPYFEVEGNLSRARTASRRAVTTAVATLYSGALINAIAIIFGPAVGRWIH